MQADRDRLVMENVLSISDDCIKVLDLDGRLTFFSEGGRRVMEVPPEAEPVGCVWDSFWVGKGRERVLAAVKAGREGSSSRFQAMADTFAGNPRWWDVRVEPLYGPDGRPDRLLAISRDITEQRETEQALLRSRERYRTLFESIDEGFCIIEFFDGPHGPLSDYVHIEANPAYAIHAGIPNVVGQEVRAMVGAEAQGWIDLYGGVLRTGRPIRFERELVATGRFLELSAFRIEPPESKQVAVLFQDITKRKRAEQELHQLNATLERRVEDALAERRLLAEIVEGASAFVQVVDTDYRILAINSAAASEFERLFGARPKVGDNMLELLADRPEHRDAVRAVWDRALGGEEFVETAQFGDADGEHGHYEMHFNALCSPSGELIGAYQFVYDVTERLQAERRLQEAEDALRQSQKMEAVGQLTGGLAHDFNNLLAGITGSLDMIRQRLAQGRTPEIDRYALAAQGAAKRAAALTHRLLAFSRRQTLSPRPTDVNRLVTDMEDLIRRTVGPGITVETVAMGGLWSTLVDANQLENALLNLCLNARDALPDGGKITIETANRWLDERAGQMRDLPPGQYVSMCVSDNGTGMTEEVARKAFDPFFTTKPIGVGTGLGLSMIYGFARQSGGQVRIYSEVGKGTMVCIYLPRHGEGEAAEPQLASPQPEPTQAGETVLVIDDEPLVRMLIVDVIEELGYVALEAGDGPQGLKILRSDARIDLLVTDVGLPNGMNGRQVADAARELRPGLNVLFITGYAENAVLSHGHLDPGMQVVTKPFDVAALGNRIRAMIGSP